MLIVETSNKKVGNFLKPNRDIRKLRIGLTTVTFLSMFLPLAKLKGIITCCSKCSTLVL